MIKIKCIPFLFFFGCSILLAQQKASINDFNFESTTNPAFTLLDETPTQINTPDNLKALGLYLSNGFSNTNLALEVNPYWLIDFETERSYEKYRGIKTNEKNKTYIDPFIGLKTNSSFSMGYIDKKFEGFAEEKKVLAIGYRTTILKFYNADRLKKIQNTIQEIDNGVASPLNKLFEEYFIAEGINIPGSGSCSAIDTDQALSDKFHGLAKDFIDRVLATQDSDDIDPFAERGKNILMSINKLNITKEELVSGYFKDRCENIKNFVNNPKTIKPIFRLDGAIGHSLLFKENEINSSTANRFGAWLTADVAVKFNDENYLHFYGIGKYVDDGFNINSGGQYFKEHFWDYGGKVELELNKLKFSYEYLERSGDGDEFRSVGNITYQVNKKISITGGFGKDFPQDDNLVTLLGINWGLNLGESLFSK
ncbi:hypothetical protein Q4Q34_06635 [Flavivirga abyssicola]|uniref:hypothetical protein n=1 Tax=Flavivirga abyssicola TaxID=3063533 RepID=UPI0026E07A34|nr:hypothetical protein [Flavivirga sp. MEBiC07777]WVK14704.1 hypothetical protein Q4Q34_06635 [Flavivirga sp. MEBiC07777]